MQTIRTAPDVEQLTWNGGALACDDAALGVRSCSRSENESVRSLVGDCVERAGRVGIGRMGAGSRGSRVPFAPGLSLNQCRRVLGTIR